ncbi:MAG: 50S ribosomal protein L30 [Bacteroidia bacterium]|nr:50S ribosomal protein L30 [Bacteroidia bacterium]
MSKVKITQVKSVSGQTARQRKTMQALGIKKMHHVIETELSPSIQGMITKVAHLIKVEKA